MSVSVVWTYLWESLCLTWAFSVKWQQVIHWLWTNRISTIVSAMSNISFLCDLIFPDFLSAQRKWKRPLFHHIYNAIWWNAQSFPLYLVFSSMSCKTRGSTRIFNEFPIFPCNHFDCLLQQQTCLYMRLIQNALTNSIAIAVEEFNWSGAGLS